MKCIVCREEAVAICRFCGRAVCAGHIQHNLFTSGFTSRKPSRILSPKFGLLVPDAVWCGICHPEHEKA